jgi:Na+/proline symporter
MWAVSLTDGVQVALLLLGLVVLFFTTFGELGAGSVAAGIARLLRETPAELLQPFPRESLQAFVGWAAVVAVGALGNIPGQDLLQRVFAARSEVVARRACVLAGFAYLSFGMVPIALGLAGRLLFADSLDRAVLPALMQVFLSPLPAVVFSVALISAVLSTIDSAILSPASVLSQNVLPRLVGARLPLTPLQWNRGAVVLVTAASLGVAFLGESAYTLLEDAYELPLVSLFVPLTLGLFRRRGGERAALASMLAGAVLWLVHYVLGWEAFLPPLLGEVVPVSLAGAATSLLAWLAAEIGEPPREVPPVP